MIEQSRIRMTAAEYEALPESTHPPELVEGQLVVKGVPTIKHQRLVGRVFQLLNRTAPDGEVFIAPVSVKFDDANYYLPDVLWISAANVRCTIENDGVIGPPDLVVEVLSPGTASIDRGAKFQTYQKHGVPEYWIVEPELDFIEVWSWVDGFFRQKGVYEAGSTFESPVLGREVNLKTLFSQ